MTGPSVILFVESNTTGTGRILGDLAEARGLRVIYLVQDPDKYPFLRERFEHARVQTSDLSALKGAVDELVSGRAKIAAITSTSEYFIASAARLASHYGLPGPAPEAIEGARDKYSLRQQLARANLPSVAYGLASTPEEALAVHERLGAWIVVKPRRGSGSSAVRLCRSAEETRAAFNAVQTFLEKQGVASGDRGALLERYVEGDEYSVEIFDGRAIGVTKKYLSEHPYFVERGHDYPAALNPEIATMVRACTERVVAALGLSWGPVHVELKVSGGQAVLIEVNPRLAGGMIPRLVALASGIDLLAATLDRSLGHVPDLTPTRQRFASIRFVVLATDGRIASVGDLDAIRGQPSIEEVNLYAPVGASLQRHMDFRDRIGHVIACADDQVAVHQAVDSAAVQLARGIQISPPEDTGRLRRLLPPGLRAILFGKVDQQTVEQALRYYALVDLAHIPMLASQRVIPREPAQALVACIRGLLASDFAELRDQEAPRGAYLLYESHLIQVLGSEVGGVLQTGRSRNDLNATVLRLQLREQHSCLMESACDVAQRFLARAEELAGVTFPAYTHYQTAFPSTAGHYLLAIATRLLRDVEALDASFDDIDRCPLGCGAGGGTSVPIDTAMTARLLGFVTIATNSIDAVASRDLALRVLSAASIMAVTLSRFAADIALWSTNEFRLVHLPDELVGSSSNMPQKRNPFLLEHVKGKCASLLAHSHAALSCSHWVPFGNSVAVGAEATKHLWSGCRELEHILALIAVTISELQVDGARAHQLIEQGYADAVCLAEALVLEQGIAFRTAHHEVGELVNLAAARKATLREVFAERYGLVASIAPTGETYMDSLVNGLKFGAGAGSYQPSAACARLAEELGAIRCRYQRRVRRWNDAREALLGKKG